MSFILKIINIFVIIVRIIFNYRTMCFLRTIHRKIYSLWISHEFKHCGYGCTFDFFDSLTGAKKMTVGNNVKVGKSVVLELYDKYGENNFDANLTIGDNTKIGPYNHISCVNKVRIGNDVLFGRRVFITDNSHGQSLREQMNINPDLRPVHSKGPVIIEDCVWIGEGVSILPGVTIGHGSIIGANAVVTKDIPPYSVAVGVPAKVLSIK